MSRKEPNATTKQMIAWSFYDFANSAYSAIIQTFVFAAYFANQVVKDKDLAAVEWGYAIAFAGVFIALFGPLIGSVADHGYSRKSWLFLFTLLTSVFTALMWFVLPDASYVTLALTLLIISTIVSEFCNIFYNAMLANLVCERRIGKWSGLGWGLGYVGGMASLILSLLFFLSETPLFCVLDECRGNVRAVFVMVGVWIFLFSLPLFLFTPDPKGLGKPLLLAAKDGLRQMKETFHHIKRLKNLALFLVAKNFYADGLSTIFIFGGIFAAATFGMSEREVLYFAIALNISAGLGSYIFAWVDEYIGSKSVIILSLILLIFFTFCLLFTHQKPLFWLFGMLLGMFVGPVQASSRALFAKMAPLRLMNQMFGFYALTGKVTAFLGPFLVGFITQTTGSTRLGISVTIAFFSLGLLLILLVKPRRIEEDDLVL